MRHISACLFFYLFVVTSHLYSNDVFVFPDSSYIYKINAVSLKKPTLKRFLNAYPAENKGAALAHLLDSLGYFNAHTDTISHDTISVKTGNRTLIDTFIVQSTYLFTIDSLRPADLPMPYDVTVIQYYANQALAFLSRRGYPFAKLSIHISDAKTDNKNRHKDSIPAAGKGLSVRRSGGLEYDASAQHRIIITLIVDIRNKCVFDSPLFIGGYKTKEKILIQDMVFKKGQIFNTQKIETSQKRLLSRSYIENVSVIAPGIVPENTIDSGHANNSIQKSVETDTIDTVAVPFEIKDKSGMGIDGAVAYNSNSESRWAGLFNLTMLNILHRAEALSLFYRGEKGLQQFETELSIPYPFSAPLFCSALFGLEIEEKNYGYLKGELNVLTQLKGLWLAGISIKAHETTTSNRQFSWNFYGVDLILKRPSEPFRSGLFTSEFSVQTGTGIADKTDGKFTRWNFDFVAGAHIPLFIRQAFYGKLATAAITSDQRDSLHQTEKIRIGGNRNIRGYIENQFPFKAVAYIQTEYLYYFNPTGSLYIFIDGGIGFAEQISLNVDDRTELLGYGIGIRVPVRFGSLSIEWARNYKERRELGRIHIRFRNNLSG